MGPDPPKTVMMGCKLPNMGAGHWTQVLCTTCKRSWTLNYLSSPCLWNCSVVVSFFLSVWILILKGFIFDQRNPSCCTKQGSARTAAGQRPTSVRERGAFMQLHAALVPVGITTKAFDGPNDRVIILPTFNWPGCILRGPTRCETPYSWCHL